jgi:hypothetical protein
VAGYTRVNLKGEVEDMAPKHGIEGIESRFARSARVAVGDEIVELSQWDAVRIPSGTMRGMEAGDDGAEILAVGAPNTENRDVEMQPGWWPGAD